MDIALRCRCGALRGVARNIPSMAGSRTVCLCDDCQAYAHQLGRAADVLDANGGTDIVPIAPAALQLTEGLEHLRCLRLVPDGMYRWYAGCCNTPIANSMPSPAMPFAGVLHSIFDLPEAAARDAAFGPIRARVQGRFGIEPLLPGTSQTAPLGIIVRTIGFLLGGFVRRRHRPSPFFDASGKPVREAYVLTAAEREALRPLCGPKPARP